MPNLPPSSRPIGNAGAGRTLAGLLLALCVFSAAGPPAQAQVTTRELLGWCEGALGGAVTAEFDAFQCTTYLRAMLDLERAAGRDLAACFGGREPDAGDLMARLLPALQARTAESPERLAGPANRAVSDWLAANCPGSDAEEDPAANNDAARQPPAPESTPPPALDPAAIELEIWRSTQRIAAPERQREALRHYLEAYPEGRFAPIARLQLDDLAAPDDQAPEPPGPTPQDTPDPPPPADDSMAGAATPEPAAPPIALSRPERLDVQTALQALGHYRMAIDGIFGPGTRAAIRAFQRDLGHTETGRLTAFQRDKLFEMAPPARPATGSGRTAAVPGSPAGEGPGAAASPSLAGPRPGFVARNFGTSTVVAVFASPVWSDSWDHNRLSSGALRPGAELLIPLFDHPGECLFDIRFVDEFRFEREYRRVDVCRALFVGFP